MTRISLVAKATAFVLMSMFAMNSFAQNEPATLSAEETTLVTNLLNNPAAQLGISSQDSTYFRELLANGNQPILKRVTVAGELGGKMFEAGDTVKAFIIRTTGGFNVFYDGNRTVEKKTTVVVGSYEPNKRVAGEPALNGKVVKRTSNSVTERDGDKEVTYNKTSLDKVSDEYLEKVVAGENKLFDNVSTDGEGRKISKLFGGLNAGGNFAFNGSELHPAFGVMLGWETKYMTLSARGTLSWSSHNETAGEKELSDEHQVLKNADTRGFYPTYRAVARLGIKAWNSVRYEDAILVYAEAGLGYCKTDGDEAQATSSLIGFTCGAGVEYKKMLGKKLGLMIDFGAVLLNKNYHDSKQDFNLGLNGSVGLVVVL